MYPQESKMQWLEDAILIVVIVALAILVVLLGLWVPFSLRIPI